ncbi:hypothetical protein HMPREF1324_0006 [Rothia aeria F0474]|uniref:Uncharacterized protein n=1 Tax=Rothia aeria F0474 TaxID=1125724 RepID=I0UVD9_9MICC|nr:hypothetical protein HMPREF1324_0006 [Rothia aeria F0474]
MLHVPHWLPRTRCFITGRGNQFMYPHGVRLRPWWLEW